MTDGIVWILPAVAAAAHAEQIAEHGGGEGVRDPGLLESALARPQHLAAYGKPDMAALAAAYAFGLARIIRSWTATSARRRSSAKPSSC